MTDDLLELIKHMAKAKVGFVIVGGFAGVVHGCSYVTQDVDVCCDFSTDNLLRLQRAISDFHPIHRMTPNKQKLELTESNCSVFKNFYLDTDIGQLNCISFVDGVGDYQQVKQNSNLIEVEGVQLCVLSIDALVEAKKAMNRPHDREAIKQLEIIKKLKKT